ncbi:LacI family DNA-binding transcriptional regulator [Xylanibacillus composti]|uniref:LacI family transcriptional regulator n=1 Tax=Xylanibacillus composti TaxID=1572762 RepID=A0A8J4H514_9BACL|nr:LacI family DNA-binding transcriptional regulator [Xylanibacillus composti]GIQ69790.1 LacI family transcriptional regulator [Xylanibacillus composti]
MIIVSSKDVAKLAGCSQSTVSRVLNRPETVHPDKREKVLQAIEALQYKPNIAARSLVAKRTNTIALISGTLRNDYFAESTDRIVEYASKHGYRTMVYFESEGSLGDILAQIKSYKVDGILISCMKLDDPHYEAFAASGIPCIWFNRRHRRGGHYVSMDNVLAAKMLTRHLLDLGHRRIAYLSGPLDISTLYERWTGFEAVMREASVPVRESYVHILEPNDQAVQKLTWKLMHQPEPPTAIVCGNDELAIASMDALLSMGLRIPADVSIAGFDDIRMSGHQAIQLTSVGQHRFDMGEVAAEHLMMLIEAKDGQEQPSIQFLCKPELFVRRSTGVARTEKN